METEGAIQLREKKHIRQAMTNAFKKLSKFLLQKRASDLSKRKNKRGID